MVHGCRPGMIIYKKIMDAIRVDGRGKDRTLNHRDKLKELIEYDYNFFVIILRRSGGSIENAIYDFLDQAGKQIEAFKMHEKAWQAYSGILKTLQEKLSEQESLHFLKCAGDCIEKSSALIMVKPEDRRLRLLKTTFPA